MLKIIKNPYYNVNNLCHKVYTSTLVKDVYLSYNTIRRCSTKCLLKTRLLALTTSDFSEVCRGIFFFSLHVLHLLDFTILNFLLFLCDGKVLHCASYPKID